MKALVLGAAVSGRGAVRLLRSEGWEVVVFDREPSRMADYIDEGIEVHSGEWSRRVLRGLDLVVTSPGFPEHSGPIADPLAAGVPVVSELELASRRIEAPIVAVTGTNGKTTTTELIEAMLADSGRDAVAAGNIGTALSDVVVAGSDPDVVVVEASSFQLRFIETFHPRVAVILNIAPDHLDWHDDFAAYAAAKARILENQTGDDLVVYDAQDAGAAAAVTRARARRVAVCGAAAPPGDGETLWIGDFGIDVSDLTVTGQPFLVDATAAAVAALELGATAGAVERTLRTFRPGPHRRDRIGTWNGVTWVDDSKATNLHAALAAVRSFPSVVLIAGGLSKGVDLAPLVAEPSVRHVVAIGEAASDLVAAGSPERVTVAASLTEAVEQASGVAVAGDTVLLAPACASFDMFTSYAARGDAFAAAVAELRRGAA
jgi:UDP-N-acetylmuramoylalanine--D-glutamate ligase